MPQPHGMLLAENRYVPQNHERSGFLRVTFHAVGAFRVVADGLELEFFEEIRRKIIGVTFRHFSLQPARQPAYRFRGCRVENGQINRWIRTHDDPRG